ncbi:urokinase plasminogen activator surface receptor isoform X2 [Salmo salar]|uniref:Urokinase plasminogen activator surface receptor isoform X2 n=1 Tax=Salmo salar TaxID=8030 RepID=A0A1S3T2R8_SALSA|nr:urokinase plasminogen activator surface receptor isoform X2 [Salmo salar]|eukprot:XP_014070872.1 PREDICTED: urokinase plasminogen activator surface receptor-like isoform X2 [Salmo salar]
MKHTIILVLACMLLCIAHGLQCFTCKDPADPTCSEQTLETCSEGQVCSTNTSSTLQSSVGNIRGRIHFTIWEVDIDIRWGKDRTATDPDVGSNSSINERIVKGCMDDHFCQSSPKISLNIGFQQFTSSCCNSSGCNSDTFSDDPHNGLQCFSCTDPEDEVCDQAVTCQGVQDHCLNDTVTASNGRSVTLRGCVSKSMCGSGSDSSSDSGSDSGSVSCCEGSLCNRNMPMNAAQPVALTVLTLLVGITTTTLLQSVNQ